MRTAEARGKNRANCSAQLGSLAVSVASLDFLTWPLGLLASEDYGRSREDTIDGASGHVVPERELHAARQRGGKVEEVEDEEKVRVKIFPERLVGSSVSR
jgi:hypothetical protein